MQQVQDSNRFCVRFRNIAKSVITGDPTAAAAAATGADLQPTAVSPAGKDNDAKVYTDTAWCK
jgi:hypothetical protein